jgi:glycosyl transferase family 25
MTLIKNLEDIKHAYYINLDHRIDRKEHVTQQLETMGITANRFNAIKMEDGAIGCSLSHLKILQTALDNKFDHVLILEDDITFLDPELFKSQFQKFMEKYENKWDVLLFAGNNMPPYEKVDDLCVKVQRCQTTTGYLVNGHYIKILLQNIKMGVNNLIYKPEEKNTYAIDKFWFMLQTVGKWYLITPLTVVQKEDYSDIEKKVINYTKLMQDLDKAEMFKAIKEMRQKQEYLQQKLRPNTNSVLNGKMKL